MIITDVSPEEGKKEGRGTSLEELLYFVRHPNRWYQEEIMAKRHLEKVLKTAHYDSETKRAILEIFEEVSLIHRDDDCRETRYGVPVVVPINIDWNFRTLEIKVDTDLNLLFKRIYSWHPLEVACKVIAQNGDFTTGATCLLHDTGETLMEANPKAGKGECLEYVAKRVEKKLEGAGLEHFLCYLPDIMSSVGALTKEREEPYIPYIRRLGEDNRNAKRIFTVKNFDRSEITQERKGYPYWKLLTTTFKSFLVANQALLYLPHRIGKEDDLATILLDYSWGHLVSQTMHTSMEIRANLVNRALRESNRYQDATARMELFGEIAVKAEIYGDRGGFSGVTPPSPKSIFHGTLLRYAGYINEKSPVPMEMSPTLEYQDATAFQQLLIQMRRRRRPIKGMEILQ